MEVSSQHRTIDVDVETFKGSLAERAVPDPLLDLPGAWQMACPQLSVGRGRLCLDAVKVAVHLLGDWGEGLMVDGTYCERTAGDDEAAMALLEVTAAAREMVSRLERIADLSRLGSVPESDKEAMAAWCREHARGAPAGYVSFATAAAASGARFVPHGPPIHHPCSCSSSGSPYSPLSFCCLGPTSGSSCSASTLSPNSSSHSSSASSLNPSNVDVRNAVLQSPDLVNIILRFLVDGSGASRDPLRNMSEVCRVWRNVSRSEEIWECVAKDLFPVLQLQGGALEPLMARGGRRRSYREYVMDYGRCLLRREIEIGDPWYAGLQLSFEIFDTWDGHSFMSATGPIGVAKGDFIEFRLQGVERRELRGTPFSAASRDPEQRRFANMRDYFERVHSDEFASSLCVRVTVTDERTGRMALLWEVSNVKRVVKLPNQYWEAFLPTEDSSFVVVEDGWVPVNCSSDIGPELTGLTNFYVVQENGQEGVPEQDKLYRLAGGDEDRYHEHLSFFALLLKPADTDVIKRFIRSLLDRD